MTRAVRCVHVPRRARLTGVLATGASLAMLMLGGAQPPAAAAAERIATQPTAGTQVAQPEDCFAQSGPGVSATVASPGPGYLAVRLGGGSGDWDLSVRSAGRLIAGAAGPGAAEVASGFVPAAGPIEIAACRNAGASGTATITVDHTPRDPQTLSDPELVRIEIDGEADRRRLESLGLDLTEAAPAGARDALLRSAAERRRLRASGLESVVLDPDLGTSSAADRFAERRTRSAAKDGLPSGREGSYRRLWDYELELKRMVADNPQIARLVPLPHLSWEGREIFGIEIGRAPGGSGSPTVVHMGLHHAREWPSGEHAIEWAWELIGGFRASEGRAARLVRRTRHLIVPVVNPDGFNLSREAGQARVEAGGSGNWPEEFHRTNCRDFDLTPSGDCGQPGNFGVDNNRNYGGLWGGPGADVFPGSSTYRGPAPFSEPETLNVRHLFSTNQVLAAVSNHTYSALVLRPPIVSSQPPAPDEPLYGRLGRRLAAQNGYDNGTATSLYDASGITEGWSYYSTGALTFTPEIGDRDFHPRYDRMVSEWSGSGASGGNRGAYYVLGKFALDDRHHSVLRGRGPAGTKIEVSKRFRTKTLPVLDGRGREGRRLRFGDRLSSSYEIGTSGRFELHLNPSTRPIKRERRGRAAERWLIRCTGPGGESSAKHRVMIERGERLRLDLRERC